MAALAFALVLSTSFLRGAAQTCAEGRADSAPGSHPLQLGCSSGGVITGVTFAQYGLISGTCPSLSTKGTKGCDADITKPVESACIGQSSCTVYCDHSCCPIRPGCCGCTLTSGSNKTELFASVPDPFPGANKSLAVQVTCSNSPPETIAPPLPNNSPGENLNKVKYFSWYSYTGCQVPGCQRNMSASAGAAYRNLAMDGDLAYLSKTYQQFSVPGMLYLQNSVNGCNHTRVYDYSPAKNGLAPGWEAAVDDCIKTLIPLAKGNGGHIHGVQLGDELVLGSIPRFSLANLTALAARFHDGLHPHDVFIFTNEGGGAEVPSWPEIPAGLDIISVDMYGSGACEAAMTQVIYERIFALLKPHQSVWLIPGLFGAAGAAWPTPNVTAMAENDESLVEKLSAYFAWADTEPRITGVMPWHWYDLGAARPCLPWCGPGYNGPPQFQLGADSFPKTLAWIADKVAHLPR